MKQLKTKIVSNERLTSDCFRLTVHGVSEILETIQPGQFVNVRVSKAMDPLFRRPFSIFRTFRTDDGGGHLQMVYKVVGRGTSMMQTLFPGDELDIVGPCGNGFRCDDQKDAHVLIGGGIGAAALYGIGERIVNEQEGDSRIYIFLGARSKDSQILLDDFADLTREVRLSTDDGSAGYQGTVTALFEMVMAEGKIPRNCTIYACGPEPMFVALRSICRNHHLPAQISIERRMACGMGICLSCVCKVEGDRVGAYRELPDSHIQIDNHEGYGYALACIDGPVFYLDEVIIDV